jgi:hypothetical protein
MVQNTDSKSFLADFKKAAEEALPENISSRIPWDKVSLVESIFLDLLG